MRGPRSELSRGPYHPVTVCEINPLYLLLIVMKCFPLFFIVRIFEEFQNIMTCQ